MVENFYDELRTVICDVPAHNFLAVLGDFNARLGPEDVPFSLHSETNHNGKYLAEMMTEHGPPCSQYLVQKETREKMDISRLVYRGKTST